MSVYPLAIFIVEYVSGKKKLGLFSVLTTEPFIDIEKSPGPGFH